MVEHENDQIEETSPLVPDINPWIHHRSGDYDNNVDDNDVDCEHGDGKPTPAFVGSNRTQYLAALAANMGAMAFGCVMSWSATALPDLRKDTSMGKITLEEESLIASIVTLGAVISGPMAGYGVERFGRRRSMLMLTLPFLAGWLMIYMAQNVMMIYAGRLVTGFTGGAFTLAAPIFTAEMASSKIRGTLAAGFDMMITVGMLYIFVVGTFLSWRMQALACGLIPILFHILMLFVYESPRYLLAKGRRDEALKALCWFRGADDPSQVEEELEKLKGDEEFADSCIVPTKATGTWRDLFEPSALKPISIVFALFLFQELSGIDAVLFYTVDIFSASGATLDAFYATIIVGIVQVIAAATGAFFVDKSGRRFLLLLSETFMVVSLGSLGLFFYLKLNNPALTTDYLGWLPLTSLVIYVVSYSIGLGPITYMIMGELLPQNVKGLASSILTSIKWLLGFVVTVFFEDILLLLGDDGGFWLFAGFCLVGLIFVLFFVPETRGKTLEEIQQGFRSKRSKRSERDPLMIAGKIYGSMMNNGHNNDDCPTAELID